MLDKQMWKAFFKDFIKHWSTKEICKRLDKFTEQLNELYKKT